MFGVLKQTNTHTMTTQSTYRLKNQKSKGFGSLYKRLFRILEKDCIFSECYDEGHYFDGEDMIITTTWGVDNVDDLPTGITQLN